MAQTIHAVRDAVRSSGEGFSEKSWETSLRIRQANALFSAIGRAPAVNGSWFSGIGFALGSRYSRLGVTPQPAGG